MGARSLLTQHLCTGYLEEAPVNNTLSDAFQEPEVSDMSVTIVMLLACAQHPRAGCSRLRPFLSASSWSGCPMGCPGFSLPAQLLGLELQEGRGAQDAPTWRGARDVPWGRGSHHLPSPVLPFHRAGEQMWSSSFHVAS